VKNYTGGFTDALLEMGETQKKMLEELLEELFPASAIPVTEPEVAESPEPEEDEEEEIVVTEPVEDKKTVDPKEKENEELELRISAIIPFIPGYDDALKALDTQATLIPPSGAIAGIYCDTDQYRGVWKAPANVSIASLSGVSDLITNQMQEDLNVDSKAGKSINAIRVFSGRGIMVWGARTLEGNSKEWRYVPVRRLFNYIEESVQKSTAWAVFSPNDGNTWIMIKSQIENFLYNLWRAGALAGSTPDAAYYVNVGLGVTMTADDILDGLLIVEIGLAAVRPAEFIVLRFSHKVQE
jgi:phage tail sheath protein FI